MGPFRGPYRGSPLWDPCWWAVTTEVAAHWEEVLMGPFRGGTHNLYFKHIFIVFINFIFKKIVLQNGFSYSLFSTKFTYETYFLKMKTKY